jgi:hypothetical protein
MESIARFEPAKWDFERNQDIRSIKQGPTGLLECLPCLPTIREWRINDHKGLYLLTA